MNTITAELINMSASEIREFAMNNIYDGVFAAGGDPGNIGDYLDWFRRMVEDAHEVDFITPESVDEYEWECLKASLDLEGVEVAGVFRAWSGDAGAVIFAGEDFYML